MFYSEETVIIFESTFPAIRHTRVSTKKKKKKKEGPILESINMKIAGCDAVSILRLICT
jgi:hypothetical protein